VVAGAAVLAAVGCVDMIRLSTGGKWQFRWSSAVEQFNYSWPLVATSLTGRLNRQLGNLLIAAMFDPAMYAIYSCGALELPVIALITSSMGAALMPNLVSLTSENKLSQAVSLWQEGARKCSLVLFPCFAFCLAISQDLMIFLYTKDFAQAAGPFAVYLFVLPIRIAVFGSLLKAVGSTRAIAVGAALSLVVNAVIGGGLIWLGGKTYLGFIGPAIGSVAGVAATAAFLLWRLEKVMGIPMAKLMRWRELGRTMAVCLVAGLVVYLVPLPAMPLVFKLCVQGVLFLAVLALLAVRFRVLHADEVDLIAAPVRTIQRMVRPQPSR
jgi:O-antigen/teichoic acid export membrane protein